MSNQQQNADAFYTGLITKVASQDKFLEFFDAMTVAYPQDYAMLQGAVGNDHAPNSGIKVQICSRSEGKQIGKASAQVPTWVFDQIKNVCSGLCGTNTLVNNDVINIVNNSYRLYAAANTLLKEIKKVLGDIVKGANKPDDLMLGIGKAVKQSLLKLNRLADANTVDESVPAVTHLPLSCSTDYSYYQVRVKAAKRDEKGFVPCASLTIQRKAATVDSSENEVQLKLPWIFTITNFSAKPKNHANGTVSYDAATVTGKSELKFSVSDDEMYRICYCIEHFVNQWERAHISDFIKGETETIRRKQTYFDSTKGENLK